MSLSFPCAEKNLNMHMPVLYYCFHICLYEDTILASCRNKRYPHIFFKIADYQKKNQSSDRNMIYHPQSILNEIYEYISLESMKYFDLIVIRKNRNVLVRTVA